MITATEANNIATDYGVDELENLFDSIKEKSSKGEFNIEYITDSGINNYVKQVLILNGFLITKLEAFEDNTISYKISWEQSAN